MITFTCSRIKIILLIAGFFVLWHSAKFLPWLQPIKQQATPKDSSPGSSGVAAPVLVGVFYEALCPDSKNFILKQLLPTMNKASKLLNVTLIPYGKAKTEEAYNGSISFTCQHGPIECLANKIHGCAISQITNPLLQVKYISCMISDNMIPELVGEKCAKEYGINWISIFRCANSERGNLLLKENGLQTDALSPKISFVPTVLLNNKHKNQASILKDFFKQVCLMFKESPKECA